MNFEFCQCYSSHYRFNRFLLAKFKLSFHKYMRNFVVKVFDVTCFSKNWLNMCPIRKAVYLMNIMNFWDIMILSNELWLMIPLNKIVFHSFR